MDSIFIGNSRVIQFVYEQAKTIVDTDKAIILGETGVGNGILARFIHDNSRRRNNKFASVNCGTLPETLFESELFGHKKGAYTGAAIDRKVFLRLQPVGPSS